MTIAILLPLIASLVQLIQALTALITAITNGQPKEVQAELWRRHMEATEWISKLMEKLSNLLEKLIDQMDKQVVPPKP